MRVRASSASIGSSRSGPGDAQAGFFGRSPALDDIFGYLDEQTGNLSLAREFVDSIVVQAEKMAALTAIIGRPRDDLAKGLRSFPFRGYLIFMRYEKEQLYVVDVLHARRDVDSGLKDSFPK